MNSSRRKRWKDTIEEIVMEGCGNRFDWIVTSEFQSSIDGHQHGLNLGPLEGFVTIRVFAHDHGRTDLPFTVVVVSGDVVS